MTECCGPSAPCCGGTPTDYDYGAAPYLSGVVDTFAGPIPRVSTSLFAAITWVHWASVSTCAEAITE